MEDNIVYLPVRELSQAQRIHWEHRLEIAERAREAALRMLGRLPIELGLEG